MSDTTASLKNDAFRPRRPGGMGKGLLFALAAHALLIAGLTFGLRWKSGEPAGIEAELWAAVPQAAAPRAVTPEPAAPPPPQPVEAPPPQPKAPEPPPAKPEPTPQQLQDAQIAIEQARREKERLEQERLQREKEEAERKRKEELAKAEAERKKKEQLAKEEAERQRKEQLAKEAADKKKKEEERLAREEAARKKKEEAAEKAQAKALDDLRQKNLERIMGQAGAAGPTAVPGVAGATGAPDARGTAQRAAGPSSGYAGRIRARIQPNIVFPDSVDGNPQALVEVRLGGDGTILSRRLVKSSGVKSWDDAVLRAIDKTEQLPRDVDGRVPPVMEISFRPHD